MKLLRKLLRIMILAAMLLSLPGLPKPVQAAVPLPVLPTTTVQASLAPRAPSTWCVAGEMNGWNNSVAPLYDDGTHGDLIPADGIFSLSYSITTAGTAGWKISKCGDWNTAYPPDNSWVYTAVAGQTVLFTFDTNNHTSDVGLNLAPQNNIVSVLDDANGFTVVGDAPLEWNNSGPGTMTLVGHGYYRYEFVQPVAGTYAAKIVRTGSWDSILAQGRSTSSNNWSYTTTAASQRVVVLLDARSGRAAFLPQGAAGTGVYCAAGDFNGWSESGFPLFDDGTNGDLTSGDGVYSRDVVVGSAGRHEWKVNQCNWGLPTYPSTANSFLNTAAAGQTVKITFDANNHSADAGWKMIPAQNIINAWDSPASTLITVGDFQGWNNADATSALANQGMGLYFRTALLSPGTHAAKVTGLGGWDSWGADNRSTNANNVAFDAYFSDEPVYFVFDYRSGRLMFYAVPPAAHAHDGLVEVNGLAHNSQDDLYRAPFGTVDSSQSVFLRFRTFHNDVEGVRVRLFDAKNSVESLAEMTLVGSDLSCREAALLRDTCDYWQLEVFPNHITNLYYRFIVQDGADVAYYADDNMKDGGWGASSDAMVDNSYVITFFDPAFEPISWMQNAVIYQIFPDRFNNGDRSNDPTGEELHYGYPTDPLDQLVKMVWDSLPEGHCRGYVNPATPCTESPRGRDFFGGDLQGVLDKLDYLQSLGVTVIYFNPIFDAGSNHGYDTRNYLNIQPFFGTNADFETLAAAAEARGIKIVLDGVFNHVSSDSPYFDRYHHYDDVVGACESLTSPYRSWFYFTQTTPGSGKCAGILGANSANYDSWWGFDSIPVMNKSNAGVQNLLLYGTPTEDPVASYWLAEGASGWRLDVMNDSTFPADFWMNFRDVVKSQDPQAVIIGELWKKGDVLPMVLGDTADTAMNYRFRNAVQGLLGTVDNKGFPDDGQSDQPPSLFAKKMISIREDYPDAAYYTLMNLLTTHDTERILWGMTPGEDNREDKEFNAANLATGIQRLKLAAVIQMTVPGAPTIYYGDEIGMTGFDDPDDRRAFPWLTYLYMPLISGGSSGVAQTAIPQEVPANYYGVDGNYALLDHFRALTAIRHANPVFSQGDLTFLLTDDTHGTLAYLLRTDSAAALVAINKNAATQTLTIDTETYLPYSYTLVDALGTLAAPVLGDAASVTFSLPPMSAAILLPAPGQNLAIPAARQFFGVNAGNGQVQLDWQVVKAGETFAIYRSDFTRGGYDLLGVTGAEVYTDTTITNGRTYYYVLRTIDSDGNYSPYSDEVSATPSYPIGWAGSLTPATITTEITSVPSGPISAEVYVEGVTNSDGNEAKIKAQIGFGLSGADFANFTWADVPYTGRVGNNYIYGGSIRPESVGGYDYVIRFTTSNGLLWSYAYVSGTQRGVITLTPAIDGTAPDAPTDLRVTNYGADFIDLAWNDLLATDVVEYWVYRMGSDEAAFQRVGIVAAPTTIFHDGLVHTGIDYQYYVLAVDGALNQSLQSNHVTQTAEVKMVQVYFLVRVPTFTPLAELIYIAGDTSPLAWNPSLNPMLPTGTPGVWFFIASFPDGATVQYKYTRGTWDKVEWWGSITSTANRSFVVDWGADGTQVVDNTMDDALLPDSQKAPQNWRDPLVSATDPFNGQVLSAVPATISVSFSLPIQPLAGEDFSNSIQVMINGVDYTSYGTVVQSAPDMLTWTPGPIVMPIGAYTVTVSNLRRVGGDGDTPMQAPYNFAFVVPPK